MILLSFESYCNSTSNLISAGGDEVETSQLIIEIRANELRINFFISCFCLGWKIRKIPNIKAIKFTTALVAINQSMSESKKIPLPNSKTIGADKVASTEWYFFRFLEYQT
jgi:hypothetical protein